MATTPTCGRWKVGNHLGDLDEEQEFLPQHDYHPTWLFNLLHTCPSTAEIVWRGFEEYVPENVVRTTYREQLCKSLALLDRLGNLQRLELQFDTPMLSPNWQVPFQRAAPDTLNRVLHKLSQQLVALRLKERFLLSPDLFWPKVDVIGPMAGFSQVPF
jgi:hypothetical protein